MSTRVNQQTVIFPDLFSRPLEAAFDEPDCTSDGGAILLRTLDESLCLTESLGACLRDGRQEGKIRHDLLEMLRQRVYGIACGYEDANDAARLGRDPLHNLLVDREPGDEMGLASQPTLSRFENSVTGPSVYRMGEALGTLVIERHRKRLRRSKVRRVTIDIDATVDPTHGAQQLTLFNGFYDTWCYLPLLGFLTFNDEPEQYLFAAMLRPGNAAKAGVLPLLKRVVARLRDAFPRAVLRVRMDGGFAGPEILGFLEEHDLEYLVAMAGNRVLNELSEPLMRKARRAFDAEGKTVTLYGECVYAAETWGECPRRVIFKTEVVSLEGRTPMDNRRYVITSLTQSPRHVYQEYALRGDSENRIKELKDGLQIDRTSCTQFLANQFRVLLTAAAYVLFQEIRTRAARTNLARAQVPWLRIRLLKIAAKLVGSVRRLVLRLCEHHPWADEWLALARACGAVPT